MTGVELAMKWAALRDQFLILIGFGIGFSTGGICAVLLVRRWSIRQKKRMD